MVTTLKAVRRDALGSRSAQRLRRGGRVPAIIYGHGEAPTPISLEQHDVAEAVHHGARLLALDLEGGTQNVLVKDLQYDAFGQQVIHLDLARVSLDERVEVTVPVVLRGKPAEEGGVVNQLISGVRVECLVTAIPEEIRASIGSLKVGESLKVSDLPLPEGSRLLEDPGALVCTVTVVLEKELAPAAEAAPTEPEVIGEKKAEAEAGEAGASDESGE